MEFVDVITDVKTAHVLQDPTDHEPHPVSEAVHEGDHRSRVAGDDASHDLGDLCAIRSRVGFPRLVFHARPLAGGWRKGRLEDHPTGNYQHDDGV
jgi:hypothetical protein